MLEVKGLEKVYRRGAFSRAPTFRLSADVPTPGLLREGSSMPSSAQEPSSRQQQIAAVAENSLLFISDS